MAFELVAAAIALFLWVDMQPGVARGVLFNVMLIAGVSTVLFNANPLLRFDGYYILQDLIEMPNLRQRAGQFVTGVLQRRLFGIASDAAAGASPREAFWFTVFQACSYTYRISVTFGIALFVGTHYFVVGVLLGLWAVVSAFVLPLAGLVAYLAFSPKLRRHRVRALAASGAATALIAALLFAVPLPHWTNAQGVLWGAEQSVVRAGADGFVTRVVARPGENVRRGEALVVAEDPLLPPKVRALEAEKEAYAARYQSERVENLVASMITAEKMKAVEAELGRALEHQRDLVVLSPADGVFAVAAAEDLPGRYYRQGQQIGYVIPDGAVLARVLVPQQSIDLVRAKGTRVMVRLAEHLDEEIPGRILREVPGASDRLPSMALSQIGGGDVALDPRTGQPKALQTYFELEIELLVPQGERPVGAGGRVFVRFAHPAQPLAGQLWHAAQQLYLRRFAL
jgi:putative peptide zinc metalloprotease protein